MENLSFNLGKKIAQDLCDIWNFKDILSENMDLETFGTLGKMEVAEIYKAKTLVDAIENKAKEINDCLDKQLDILEGIAIANLKIA